MGLDYCYHCHTARCGHASGTDEEYVLEAIKAGIKRLGISDHVFLPGVDKPKVRGNYNQLDEYISSILSLKEKYKDKIDIIIGFEAEYLPTRIELYKDYLNSKKIDYLILGQHYHEIDGEMYGYREYINTYADDVVAGIRTGLFKYLAHPDTYLYFGHMKWDDEAKQYANKILKACEETHTPIEINVCGLRDHREYPSVEFFKYSKKYNLEYVIGIDAHNPKHFNKEDIDNALKFAEELGLKIKDLYI